VRARGIGHGKEREIRGQRTDDRGQKTVFRIADGEMRGKESGDRSQEAKSIKHLVKDFVFTLCPMPYYGQRTKGASLFTRWSHE
jgi:hypothetical protein